MTALVFVLLAAYCEITLTVSPDSDWLVGLFTSLPLLLVAGGFWTAARRTGRRRAVGDTG